MGNFKVKVNSEAESREAQELFQKLVGKENGFITMDKSIRWVALYQGQVVQYEFLPSVELNEITLPELRAMVNPMKEYLDANRNYEFVLSTEKDDGFIEIPEGAEVATICRNYIIFWKDEKYSFSVSEENKWCYKSCDDSRYFSLSEYMNEYGDVSITWQRDQDEPFLTPECTLNDQYAEIEKVRQHRHYFIDVSDVDEIDFYEIALRYNVTDPCIQHILKKCLAVGQRGQKDFHHDLKDIYDTAKRMLDVHGLDS